MFDLCDGSDPLLEEMARKGVNILLPPIDEIAAGDLIVADHTGVARRADWSYVLGCDPVKVVARSDGFGAVKFQQSKKLKTQFAFSFVARCLFGGVPGTHISSSLEKLRADAVEIKLVAPAKETLTNLDAVLDALTEVGASPAQAYANRRLLMVVKAWRAKAMKLVLSGQYAISPELAASVAEELSAKGGVSVHVDVNGSMFFTAEEPLIFGLGLRSLEHKNGIWRDSTPKRHVAVRGDDDEDEDRDEEGRFAFVNDHSPFVELACD